MEMAVAPWKSASMKNRRNEDEISEKRKPGGRISHFRDAGRIPTRSEMGAQTGMEFGEDFREGFRLGFGGYRRTAAAKLPRRSSCTWLTRDCASAR